MNDINKGARMKHWAMAVSLMILGGSMSACAVGGSGTSWKEEVLLHDGGKVVVARSQSYGGLTEPGKNAPIKEHTISFTLPGTDKIVSWTSEYGEDLGRTNFTALTLHIQGGVPYLIVNPNLCLSYNKWGRPNPPYVLFKYDGVDWQRIPLVELPADFKNINLIINTKRETEIEQLSGKTGFVPADGVREINSSLTQPEYKTILRETVKGVGAECEELIRYKGHWIMPNDPVARRMLDQQSE